MRVVFWNDWLVRFTQTPSEIVTGKLLVESFPMLAATRLPSAIEGSFQNGTSSILTHSLNKLLPLRDDRGTELIYNLVVRPVSSGSSQHCVLQLDDVTVAVTRERVLRERQNARYHAIVDSAPDAIITIDLDLSIQWVNAAASRLFGYNAGQGAFDGPDEQSTPSLKTRMI